MKAWAVYFKDEPEHSDYLWAPTAGKAKSAAIELLFTQLPADFTDIRVRHLPELDGMEKDSRVDCISKLILRCDWDYRLPSGEIMNVDNFDKRKLEVIFNIDDLPF